jgi:hypothetical protein
MAVYSCADEDEDDDENVWYLRSGDAAALDNTSDTVD